MKKITILLLMLGIFAVACKKKKAEIFDKQANIYLTNHHYDVWITLRRVKNANFDDFTFEWTDTIYPNFNKLNSEGYVANYERLVIDDKEVRNIKNLYDYYDLDNINSEPIVKRTDNVDDTCGNIYGQNLIAYKDHPMGSMSINCLFKLKKGPSGTYDTLMEKAVRGGSHSINVRIRMRDSIPSRYIFYKLQ